MTITLEQIRRIHEWREKQEDFFSKSTEKDAILSDTVTEITGKKYELDDLLNQMPIDEVRNSILEGGLSFFSEYESALVQLEWFLLAQKSIKDLINQGVLIDEDDLDSSRRNVAKILSDEALVEHLGGHFSADMALKLYLQKIYDVVGKPKTEEEKANMILSIPMEYFGLPETVRPLFKAELLDMAVRHDFFRGEDHYFDFFQDLPPIIEKAIKKHNDYFQAINILNLESTLKQTRIAELGGLPLASIFHKGRLYALILDEEPKPKIVAYSLDGNKVGEMNLGRLAAPFSLAGYGDNLIFVNGGIASLIDDNLNYDLDYEPKDDFFRARRFDQQIGIEGIIKVEQSQLQKFSGSERDWGLQSITTMDDYIAAILYNSGSGEYVLALKQGDSDLNFTAGTSFLIGYSGIRPNAGFYGEQKAITLSMGGATFPPKIAMLKNGILISEGKSIRLLNYDLEEIRRYTLGEKEFEVLDDLIPFNVLAGGGDYFGIYGVFQVKGDERTSRTTPPIFLIFSMNSEHEVKIEGALHTENLPLNVATGIDFSEDGYLAISGGGGSVFVDIPFPEDDTFRRNITLGSLEIYKLTKTGQIEYKPIAMIPAEL